MSLSKFFPFESCASNSEQEHFSSVFVVRDPIVSDLSQVENIGKAIDQAVKDQASAEISQDIEKRPNTVSAYRVSFNESCLDAQAYAEGKSQCTEGSLNGFIVESALNTLLAKTQNLQVRYEGRTTASGNLQHVYVISSKFPESLANLQKSKKNPLSQTQTAIPKVQNSTGHFFGKVQFHDPNKPTLAQLTEKACIDLQLRYYPYGRNTLVDVTNPSNFPWITQQVGKCSTLQELEQLHPALQVSQPGKNRFIELLDTQSFIAYCKQDQRLQEYPAAYGKINSIMNSADKELISEFSKILNTYHYMKNFKHIYDATSNEEKANVTKYAASKIVDISKNIDHTKTQSKEARKHVNIIANLLTEYPELSGMVSQLGGDVAAIYKAHAYVIYDVIKDAYKNYDTKPIIQLTNQEEIRLLALNNAANKMAEQNGYFQHLLNKSTTKVINKFQEKSAELVRYRACADHYSVNYQQFKNTINSCSLNPLIFTTNYAQVEQQEAQKELFTAVKSLNFTQNELTSDAKRLVKEFTYLTASLIENNKLQEAQSILSCINKTTIIDFFKGVGTEVSAAALNMALSLPVGIATQCTLSMLSPQVVGLFHLGSAAYGIYNNAAALKADLNVIIKAASEGSAYEIGQATAKLAGSTFAAATTGRLIYKSLVGAKAKGVFQQAVGIIEQSIEKAKEFELMQQESQALMQTVKSLPMYTELAEEAAKVGSPIQAFEKRIKQICDIVKEPEQVYAIVKEIHKCLPFKPTNIPKGLTRPLKYNIDHKFRLEIKNNGITGFHWDVNNIVEKSGKVKITHRQTETSGISRALVQYGMHKPKESTFFSNKEDSLYRLDKINKALEAIDYTQYKMQLGTMLVVPFTMSDGIRGQATINWINSDVITWYPKHENWEDSLLKLIFSKS